ncbi:hypothetical protein KRX52_05070 [Pseudomonas sp. MAP12]|uniref:Uncharacterized protein n=1 Tax=Geopseudomonas aromaticivorans TaxID=2849492 RepID=A0ABS6MTN1_9GAMM|nr:hypothetical protein [Pseudomonas aromaticivorans]MBV2132168.1 hypothetical protein [Pseudomonas aromaticivorans]
MESPQFQESGNIEKAKIKSFHKWMTEHLGQEEWASRRAELLSEIRRKESSIDLRKPIEPQLYAPPENDINWYILAAELAWDHPYSDSNYSTRRIYPYAMTLGEHADQLRHTPNVDAVINKMLGNKSSPENQIFELITAAHYIKNGYEVEFIPENSITWPNNSKKSPDLRAKKGFEFYVECKRAAKQTKYSQDEEAAWGTLWESLSNHMLLSSPWHTVDITFHCAVSEISPTDLINAYDAALSAESAKYDLDQFSLSIQPIDKPKVLSHYEKNSVRPNCPQHELLVFGNTDSNEKRSIATIATDIVRPGDKDTILNIFVCDVANCAAAQWRCDHETSLERRSKHFKSLMAHAASQIPPQNLGVIHILYETREGINVENIRREKHLEELSEYNASDSMVLAVLIHAVNYYPKEDDYQWAETLQHFARVPNFVDTFYQDPLMLGDSNTPSYVETTHWQQDEEAKLKK